ncbi:hypothetical protein OI25_1448 [Paraburkholderia fungorum]|uniref:TnsA endonuclease N-terminal domain-containing protein n=1 Tax=Paraburkholderia fungorum TaxID=134537 RepID=A0AAU8TDH7_9BURK|nr:TnsA endonuclease N-terminal domain-containing protein [Paraburkholderia fungorum]AJZ58250.1 hypothetical protein OI25_1448 [Paraburkholderia fungorum]
MFRISWKGTWRGRSPDGIAHQPARDVVRRAGGIVRGKFPSRKNGRMVRHEGLLELDALYLFEASPLVVSYKEQPEKIRYPDGRRLRRYTPDFELSLSNGSSVIVEVKPKQNADRPDIRRKLNAIADFYLRQGREFVVLTDVHIRLEPRLENLRLVYHRAPRVRPTALKATLALARLGDVFPMTLSSATHLLSSINLDPYSLLMAGLLVCDLTAPFTHCCLLDSNLESNHEWFRLSDRLGF